MRCDQVLRSRIEANLRDFEPVRAEPDPASSAKSARGAAVAITVVDSSFGPGVPGLPEHDAWRDDAALILTRRSPALRNHPGQWALPGGVRDPGEDVETTALRELHEEVDLLLEQGDVLGTLDDFRTRSGFVITPVVVWAGADRELTFNPLEVASIHRIPIAEFLRDDAPLLDPIPESTHPVLRMPVGDTSIAAPTAAMIYQFREVCILGHDTRVAHFEQPYFAWR